MTQQAALAAGNQLNVIISQKGMRAMQRDAPAKTLKNPYYPYEPILIKISS